MHFEIDMTGMYMSCVPYGMCGLVVVLNFALALLSFVRRRRRLDVARKFAMAVLLMCKTKTWRQYVGGCTSNIVCIGCVCVSYVMYVLHFVVDVVIVLVRPRLWSDKP